jgi:hypothetical protein
MGAERRRSPRVVVTDVAARLTVGGDSLTGQVQDICRDAVLVEVERDIAMDTPVTVEVELPGVNGLIRASGPVVRRSAYSDGRHSIAILFDDLPKEHLMRVDLFISEQEE